MFTGIFARIRTRTLLLVSLVRRQTVRLDSSSVRTVQLALHVLIQRKCLSPSVDP